MSTNGKDDVSTTGARYRLGVALGGGSARGFAHLGALASLERNGYYPDLIVGTSFGAVVGALYATGRPLEDVLAQARALRRRDVFPYILDFGLHKAALFKGEKLEEYFDRLLEGRHFEDLSVELMVVTTDIDDGEEVLLSTGPLAPALRASASLPGIFAPAVIGGRRLIDGGIGSPVPIDTLSSMDVEVAVGIGAGMEARDSGSIRFARRLMAWPQAQRVHSAVVARKPSGDLGRLGRALAFAAEGWARPDHARGGVTGGLAGDPADQGADDRAGGGVGGPASDRSGGESTRRLSVHTHPPIHWLNFGKAAEAITAGDAALSKLMPSLARACGAPAH